MDTKKLKSSGDATAHHFALKGTLLPGDVIRCSGGGWDRVGVVGLPDHRDRLVVWFEVELPGSDEPRLKSWTLEQIEREMVRDKFDIVLLKNDSICGCTMSDTKKQIAELSKYRDRLILEAIRGNK